MMIIFRKILFYLFFALYLILCPIIILYALGYIFTPKVEEGFTKTGLIHIETLPSNAFISIGNRRYAERTPVTVRNLLSGQYDVKILLRGHRPWERQVKVEPGKAVNLEKVLLVPQSIKIRILLAEPFRDLLPIPGTRYLLLKSSHSAGDLKVFDWRSEVSRSVLPKASSFATAKIIKIFRVKDSSFIILQVETSGSMKFLGCQLDKEGSEVKDLSVLFVKGEPREISWEGDHPNHLFALQGQALSRSDLEKMVTFPDFLSNIRGFGIFKNKVYALQGSSMKRVFFSKIFSGAPKNTGSILFRIIQSFSSENGESFSRTRCLTVL
jgi:hypothetical protein